MTWKLKDNTWHHVCPKKGAIKLKREQMNVYYVDKQNRPIENVDAKGKWTYDNPPGCPFCGELPVELAAVVTLVDKRSNGKRKAMDG